MKAPARNDAVNGVRGMAVLAIVAHHYMPTDFFTFNIAKTFNALIITVGAYFFASAMVQEGEALQGDRRERVQAVGRLLRRQMIRVWPMLWLMVALYLALAYVDGGELTMQITRTWWLYALDLGDVPKWLYGEQAFPAHFWTIAAQDQVIAFMGVFMIFAGLEGLKRALPWLIAFGLAARVVGTALLMPDHPSWALETPLAVLDVACLGVLTRLSLDAPGSRNRLRQMAYTGALVSLSAWMILPNFNPVFYGILPFAITLLSIGFILTATDPLRARSLSTGVIAHPWLSFIGRIGLSLFFIHPFINSVLALSWPKLTGTLIPWWTLLLIGPPISIVAAWLMHVGVEQPLVRVRRRTSSATKPIHA